eukprot:743620-Amorphochlora_amoeboformis.AAC.1
MVMMDAEIESITVIALGDSKSFSPFLFAYLGRANALNANPSTRRSEPSCPAGVPPVIIDADF